MTVSFDEFKQTLSGEQRTVLEKILEEEARKKSRVLLEHIERDKKHLEKIGGKMSKELFQKIIVKDKDGNVISGSSEELPSITTEPKMEKDQLPTEEGIAPELSVLPEPSK